MTIARTRPTARTRVISSAATHAFRYVSSFNLCPNGSDCTPVIVCQCSIEREKTAGCLFDVFLVAFMFHFLFVCFYPYQNVDSVIFDSSSSQYHYCNYLVGCIDAFLICFFPPIVLVQGIPLMGGTGNAVPAYDQNESLFEEQRWPHTL